MLKYIVLDDLTPKVRRVFPVKTYQRRQSENYYSKVKDTDSLVIFYLFSSIKIFIKKKN